MIYFDISCYILIVPIHDIKNNINMVPSTYFVAFYQVLALILGAV